MRESRKSTLPRRELGRKLREAREGIGLSIDQVAGLADMSTSALQRLETGQCERIKIAVIHVLCDIYGLDEVLADDLASLAQQTVGDRWWHEFRDIVPRSMSTYVALESAASSLTAFEPYLIPGLLQTPGYARGLVDAAFGDRDVEDREKWVRLKARRQVLIKRKYKPLTVSAVVHEAALRNVVGGRKVMVTQLEYLADTSTRPNIGLRVLPFSAGVPLGRQLGPMVILEFVPTRRGRAVEPTTVFVESYIESMYSDKMEVVEQYRQGFRVLQRASLDEVESRSLIRRIAKELA